MDASPVSSDVSIESVDAAASAAWDAIVAQAPEPPVPAATPAPEPVTNTEPVVEAKVDVPPPAEGTNPEKAVEPTSYEKWVAKYGDPNKAADAAWETNNRASELARKVQELEAKLAQPAATNAPEAVEAQPVAPVPAPVVEPAPEQVETWVSQYVAQDQACLNLDQQFRSNRERLNVLTDIDLKSTASISAAAREVQKLEAWLLFPEVAADEFQKAGIETRLTLAQTKHERLLIEAQRLGFENRNLKSEFDGRANQYRSQIQSHYETQKRAAQEKQDFDSQVTRYSTELEKAWSPALDRTVKQYALPESEIADFTEDVKTAALAQLEAGIKVEDLDGFMGKFAKRYMDRLDRNHRQKSAEYARQAGQRATTPAPVPSVVPQVQPSTGDLIKDARAHEELMWAQIGAGR